MGPSVALAAAGLLVCGAGSAAAATRYVSSTGSNKRAAEPCLKRAPCGLRRGIEKGRGIDRVVVASGAYAVSEEIEAPAGLDVRAASRVRPRLAGATRPREAILSVRGKSNVSGLRISQSGDNATAVINNFGAVLENVQLVASGDGAVGLQLGGDAVLRNSTIWAGGARSRGISVASISSGPSLIRNATVMAQGPDSTGIRVDAFSAGGDAPDDPIPPIVFEGQATVVNTVVRGSAVDLQADGDFRARGTIDVSYSNFATVDRALGNVNEGEGNQSAAPLFVDPARGDFHQLPGSPTVDAGTPDPANGRSDPDGDPRRLGLAPDIGADELVPAAATPSPPPGRDDPGAEPGDTTAPVITRLSMSRRRFVPARRGTVFRLRVSEQARIAVRIVRLRRGRRVHVGTLRRAGRQGANRVRFSGRVRGRALRPGRYRARVRARDSADNLSRPRRVRFRIVRPL